jgi:hypothetical protein
VTERVRILYEDSGDPTEFGPHKLVARYACDRLGVEPWQLRDRLKGDPKRGNANVLKACREDLGKLVKGGWAIVAVYDSDQIGHRIGLPRGACKSQLVARLKQDCEPRDRLVVVLLEENVETLLRAIAAIDPALAPPATLQRALGKDLNCRDIILAKAASPPARAMRDRLAERVPSLAYLVRRVVALLAPEPS